MFEMKREITEIDHTFKHDRLDSEGLIKEEYFLETRKVFYKFHEEATK
jgi:hypothetical protein